MSLTEILAEIPKLSFAERQELVRRTIELEDHELTPARRRFSISDSMIFAATRSQASTAFPYEC